jgi:chromate transport protein ChrA
VQLTQAIQHNPQIKGSRMEDAIVTLVYIAAVVFMIASVWVVFSKAGKPGWASIIPIYNVFVILSIAKKPAWWLILFLIPFVNFVMAILVANGVATNFGKNSGFGLGLFFLPFVFYPILAFGDARYQW